MSLFPFTKDVQAFLLRVTASLERIDGAVADVQHLVRNANEAVTEIRAIVATFKSGVAIVPKEKA